MVSLPDINWIIFTIVRIYKNVEIYIARRDPFWYVDIGQGRLQTRQPACEVTTHLAGRPASRDSGIPEQAQSLSLEYSQFRENGLLTVLDSLIPLAFLFLALYSASICMWTVCWFSVSIFSRFHLAIWLCSHFSWWFSLLNYPIIYLVWPIMG